MQRTVHLNFRKCDACIGSIHFKISSPKNACQACHKHITKHIHHKTCHKTCHEHFPLKIYPHAYHAAQAGVDLGGVHLELNTSTGRITYRGRVLNRASRISSLAGTGEVGVGDWDGPGLGLSGGWGRVLNS